MVKTFQNYIKWYQPKLSDVLWLNNKKKPNNLDWQNFVLFTLVRDI